MEEENPLFKHYQVAIDARNFHYDSFNKWMTYYYVAMAGIYVAYSSKDCTVKTEMALCGLLISVLWHLSSKGYYFWVMNWIDVVKLYERELHLKLGVYTILSKETVDTASIMHPLRWGNISTSKVTLLFSYVTSLAWAYEVIVEVQHKICMPCCTCLYNSFLIRLPLSFISVTLLIFILSRWLESGVKGKTILFEKVILEEEKN